MSSPPGSDPGQSFIISISRRPGDLGWMNSPSYPAIAPRVGWQPRLSASLACVTLYYMKSTLTVRVDADTERLLARVVELSGRSQSEVVRDALRRQLSIELFEQLRRRTLPFAEAQGLLTDEDVFEAVS